MDENAIIIELIKGCLAHKKGHQKKLYQAFYGFAHSIALRYMSNREEAAIVMNKGFYRAFTSLKEYKETTSFKKWLHNLLVQAVIQYYFDKMHHLDAIAESKIEYGYSISHNLKKSYAYGDYIKLLHQLPDACRIVFNLFVIDGYKHERIARLLHISVYTSESLLHRARNELRSLISADN